ncbi:hypothetical protein DPMN_113703 [Dreissena polymorpha]|uniref:Secreted protein n=1 Tax=Dreissena polymorpha TaxID=45954 RepID=A0A9D4QQX1_DREPO|nr:hypothetical protein DPMN_113703 [Dreissena polymorpha]
MKTIGAFVCVIALCYAATTHRPHGGHDHNEQDSATFQYVGSTQHLLVQWYPDKSTYNCYIVSLTDVEKAQVHTDAGMRAVEATFRKKALANSVDPDETPHDAAYPFIHLGGEEQMWDKFLAQEKFQCSGRDSKPGPLDRYASVLPLDHCSH